MKNILTFVAVTASLMMQLPAQAATQPQVEGCPYMAPPADSLVVEGNHHLPGMTFWPRAFPPAYTGCAYIWYGKRVYTIARWRDGKVIDGVIDEKLKSIWDESDLPPMVYCKKSVDDTYSDCGRFTQLWRVEFPGIVEEINTRGKQ